MIFTRMGSEVEKFISREQDESGNWWIKCRLKGMNGDREIHPADFRADSAHEIDSTIEALTDTTKR